MREIKFRAWNGTSLEYGGFYIHTSSGKIIPTPLTKCKKDSELMQFTGLKDKNGKEIYEGDIVETNTIYHGKPTDPMFLSKIIYNEHIGAWQISYLNIENHFVNDNIGFSYQLKIVGNIHKNPELLK